MLLDPQEKRRHSPDLLLTVEQARLLRLRHTKFSNSTIAPTWYSQLPSTDPLSAAWSVFGPNVLLFSTNSMITARQVDGLSWIAMTYACSLAVRSLFPWKIFNTHLPGSSNLLLLDQHHVLLRFASGLRDYLFPAATGVLAINPSFAHRDTRRACKTGLVFCFCRACLKK